MHKCSCWRAYQFVKPWQVRELLAELGPVAGFQMRDEGVEAHRPALGGVVGHLAVADLRDHHGQRPDVGAGVDLRRGHVQKDLRARPVDVPEYWAKTPCRTNTYSKAGVEYTVMYRN